jgi:hypothetical protein
MEQSIGSAIAPPTRLDIGLAAIDIRSADAYDLR